MLIEKFGTNDARALVVAFALSFTLANISIEDITDHFGIDEEHAEQALAEAQGILNDQSELFQTSIEIRSRLEAMVEQMNRAENAHLN